MSKFACWLAAATAGARGRQDGQGLAEYSLLLALIAVVAIAGLLVLGTDVTATLSSIGTHVSSVVH